MASKLDRKRAFGAITGILDGCPLARFSQDHAYFDSAGTYLQNTDGSVDEPELMDPVAPEEKPPALQSMLAMNISEVTLQLPDLADDELETLLAYEKLGNRRVGMITNIQVEIDVREGLEAGIADRLKAEANVENTPPVAEGLTSAGPTGGETL